LVRRRVAVIYAGGATGAALAAKAATTTIPIIFAVGNDPVEAGLVASFNRPGGNLTGISMMLTELTGKRLGLLHELVPSASRFALLVDSNIRDSADQTAGAKAAVATLGRQIEVFTASTNDEIDSAFARIVQWRAEALLIGASPLFASTGQGGRQLATLAVRHTLPAIHFQREFIEIGGLMSYGPSIPDTVRQAGIYVGRVLKGEKATDLPVMQPTRFQLLINLTTAKAIGLEVPPMLLALADEVIQ
jgi:putative ABC transport system substrate-binding protein